MAWMMAAQIAKSVVTNATTLWATKADSAAMKTEAKQYKAAAAQARVAAVDHANIRGDQLRSLLSRNVVDAASRGVDAYEGSSAVIQQRTMAMGSADIEQQKINDENQARQYEYAAAIRMKKARQMMVGAVINMAADTGMTSFQNYQTMGGGPKNSAQAPSGGMNSWSTGSGGAAP